MVVSLIVAAAENGAIGLRSELPWHLPDDLKRFKRLTTGHHLIVGRKTWETVGRPLPGRTMIVVTRQPGYVAEGALVVGSLEEALAVAEAAGDTEPFVAGGGEIYARALADDRVDRIHLTRVHASPPGDAFFPAVDPRRFRLVAEEPHPADARHRESFAFLTYDRAAPPGDLHRASRPGGQVLDLDQR